MPDIVVALFLLGVVSGLVGSDLRIPGGAYHLVSILLMLGIGLKGGLALHGNLSVALVPELLLITAAGFAVPLALYPALRKIIGLNVANSASLAAHYGSVSAGTFAVVLAYAQVRELPIAPQTTLYLVLLEMPAIIAGIVVYRRYSQRSSSAQTSSGLLHEALTGRSVLLLAGGVVIGYLYGPTGVTTIAPFFLALFPGLLGLFLLEMGITTAGYIRAWQPKSWRVVGFGLVVPPLLALVGMLMALALSLPAGSALILATLMASASYIAAPAAIRHAIPEADVGMAMVASLGVTFPFNILVGIPVYHALIN